MAFLRLSDGTLMYVVEGLLPAPTKTNVIVVLVALYGTSFAGLASYSVDPV